LSSFHEAEDKSILVGFSFGLGPANVCDPFTRESNNEGILALALKRVNGKKLRDPVCYDLLELLSGHRSNRFKSSALMNRAAGVLDIFHHRTTREEMIRNSHNQLTLEKHLIYQTS
jgi:D-serine dehydratase